MTRPRPALLVLPLLLVACSGLSAPPAGSPSGSPAIRVADAPLLPTTVDALPATDAGGFQALLGQLRGTPVVVNLWASWCEPCTEEMPMLVEAAQRHAATVQFLGVDVLDNRDSANGFIDRFRVPFPNLFDPNGDVKTAVGAVGQPVTIFYAADGTVVAKVEGQLDEETLRSNLDAIAA